MSPSSDQDDTVSPEHLDRLRKLTCRHGVSEEQVIRRAVLLLHAHTFDERMEVSLCADCGKLIDPSTCHCGTELRDHDDPCENHAFVPAGCDCYRDRTLPTVL